MKPLPLILSVRPVWLPRSHHPGRGRRARRVV